MAKIHPQVASLASQLAARLEVERSLGVSHMRMRLRQIDSIPSAGSDRVMARTSAEVMDGVSRGLAAVLNSPATMAVANDNSHPMQSLCARALACTACQLHESRRNVVCGEGALETNLVFVGEAPGRDEDEQGRPFVGPAGQLLTRIIEGGLGRPRSSVYICNILKCRPPGNRDPLPDEVHACTPFLTQQLGIVRPRVIVALGRVAGNFLTGQQLSMGRLRGCWWEYEGIALRAIYHPAYILRQRRDHGRGNPVDRKTMEDLRAIKDRLRE